MNRQIECIKRYALMHGSLDDIIQFLLDEKVMDSSELALMKQEVDRPGYLWQRITKAKELDKVLLFDFEWQILPIERIKITIVTNRDSKEFKYNYG